MTGSGANGELTWLDLLNVLSFYIGLKNLDLNIDQNDMDRQTKEIDERANELVHNAIAEIHQHLEAQDEKIDRILILLGDDKIENHQEVVKND